MASVTVFTNSFEIIRSPKNVYIHYDAIVDRGKPERSEPFKPRRAHEIVQKMQTDHAALFSSRIVYDGRANLFVAKDIPSADYPVHMGLNPSRGHFIVRLQKSAVINPRDIENLTRPGGSTSHASSMAINLLQLIVRQDANLRHGFPPEGRSFFLSKSAIPLPGGLQAWRGYFQSVRPVVNRLLINVDTSTAAMYSSGSLLDLAMGQLRVHNRRDLEDLDHKQLKQLEHFLKNVLVVVNIQNPSRVPRDASQGRARPIKGLVHRAGEFIFEKDGVSTSVKDHFAQQHNYRLQFPRHFGVKIGKTAVFPAEVCIVPAGQIYRRKLSPDVQAQFIKFSTQRPVDKMNAITEATSGEALQYDHSLTLREAGVKVQLTPIQVNGHILNSPSIQYGNATVHVNKMKGGWNLVRQQFYRPRKVPFWAVAVFQAGSSSDVARFVQKLCDNLVKLGLIFFSRQPHIEYGNARNVNRTLDQAAEAALNLGPPGIAESEKKVTFLLVVLPKDGADIRAQVKYWGDVLHGVPTQCVQTGKYEAGNDQYCNNVALKINAKTGRINSTIISPVNKVLSTAMIVGADVSHPAPGVLNRPSIASLVASMDDNVSNYTSQIHLQEPRHEIIANLRVMMLNVLGDFYSYHNRHMLPQSIMFYRDGVSEGEFDKVFKEEIQHIEDAVAEAMRRAHSNDKPKLVFIIVGKRHHIRFFPQSSNDADDSGNCPSGFVADTSVTNTEIFKPQYKDFYLQSHSALKGTSRPSHYIVLKNEMRCTLVELQELSYVLCHVYASATRSVSIPAPVYYADRVCARAAYHFDPATDLHLDDETLTSSSDAHREFDMTRWQAAFRQSAMNRRLYFL